MGKRKRRSFTREYKAEVVDLIRKSGKSIGAVARELDQVAFLDLALLLPGQPPEDFPQVLRSVPYRTFRRYIGMKIT